MSHSDQPPEAGAGPLEAVVVPLDLTANPADVFAAMAAQVGVSLDQAKPSWTG